MPRVYYNDDDIQVQMIFFAFHSLIYIGGLSFLWITSLAIAPVITIIWTFLLCYHNYWRTTLEDSMQQRTYDRLRNRFGLDWDLEATTEDFDFEYRKTILEAKLRHSLPDTLSACVMPLVIVLVLFVVQGNLPVSFIGNSVFGAIILLSFLQISLRVQLRQQAQNYHSTKKKQVDTSSMRLSSVNQHPRVGMTYAVGDDGELIEVPQREQQAKDLPD